MKEYKQLEIPDDSAGDRFSIKRYLPDWLNNFVNGCSNLIRWFPVIWKDRNWDDYYIFEILKKKLLFQRKYLVDSNRHMNVWQNNRDITICLNLIERLQDSYYECEYQDYCKTKIDFVKLEGEQYKGQDLYEMKSEDVWEDFEPFFKKYKHTLNILQSEKYKVINFDPIDNHRNALWVSHINQDRAKKLLFKILEERIETLWD